MIFDTLFYFGISNNIMVEEVVSSTQHSTYHLLNKYAHEDEMIVLKMKQIKKL